jgi:hypothetical protein
LNGSGKKIFSVWCEYLKKSLKLRLHTSGENMVSFFSAGGGSNSVAAVELIWFFVRETGDSSKGAWNRTVKYLGQNRAVAAAR